MRKQKRSYQRPTMTVYPIEKMSLIICQSGGGQGGSNGSGSNNGNEGAIPRSFIYDDEPLKA